MGNKKARYPIRYWLGKFESWLIVMRGGSKLRTYDDVLERFFATFPHKKGLEEFTSIDVSDYKTIRATQISDRSLKLELWYLRVFWRWLVEDNGLCLPTIRKAFNSGDWKPSTTALTLSQVNALLAACDSDDDRRIILKIMAGGKCPGKRLPRITAAAQRAGLAPGFSLGKLRIFTINRLAREVVQTYCNQLLDTLAPESKTASNSLRTVESSSLEVGSSIRDCHDHPSPVDRVNQQKACSEG